MSITPCTGGAVGSREIKKTQLLSPGDKNPLRGTTISVSGHITKVVIEASRRYYRMKAQLILTKGTVENFTKETTFD